MNAFSSRFAKWLGFAALAMTAAAAHANLVTNGGFETGDLSGWSQFGNTGFTGAAGSPYNHTGSFGAAFGPVGSTGGVSQSLATVAGATYTVNFWLYNDGGTPNIFSWAWDGTTQAAPNLVNAAGFGYTEYTFNVTASGASTDLAFTFQQNPAYYGLDDVSVTQVPEPGTILLFGAALVAAGAARRRKPA